MVNSKLKAGLCALIAALATFACPAHSQTQITVTTITPTTTQSLPMIPRGYTLWDGYWNGAMTTIDADIDRLQRQFQGTWSSTTSYSKGQDTVVTSGGTTTLYQSLVNTNVGNYPPTSSTSWVSVLSSGGGLGGGGSVTLETNGGMNSDQSLLDLVAGANITLTASGGQVVIASTGGGSMTWPVAGIAKSGGTSGPWETTSYTDIVSLWGCTGYLKSDGTCGTGGGGGSMTWPSAGIAKSGGTSGPWETPTYADIVSLWGCTGYLKNDGTCGAGGIGTIITPGTNITCTPYSSITGNCSGTDVTINAGNSNPSGAVPTNATIAFTGISIHDDDLGVIETPVEVSPTGPNIGYYCNTISSTPPYTCIVNTLTAHGLAPGDWVNMRNTPHFETGSSNFPSGIALGTGYSLFQVTAVTSPTQFQFQESLAEFVCPWAGGDTGSGSGTYQGPIVGCGTIAQANFNVPFATWIKLGKPGTVEMELPAPVTLVGLDTNFNSMFSGLTTPCYVVVGNELNDIQLGVPASTLKTTYQGIWTKAHALGCKVVQESADAAAFSQSSFGYVNAYQQLFLVENWLKTQGPQNGLTTGGDYWDLYADVFAAVNDARNTNLVASNQGFESGGADRASSEIARVLFTGQSDVGVQGPWYWGMQTGSYTSNSAGPIIVPSSDGYNAFTVADAEDNILFNVNPTSLQSVNIFAQSNITLGSTTYSPVQTIGNSKGSGPYAAPIQMIYGLSSPYTGAGNAISNWIRSCWSNLNWGGGGGDWGCLGSVYNSSSSASQNGLVLTTSNDGLDVPDGFREDFNGVSCIAQPSIADSSFTAGTTNLCPNQSAALSVTPYLSIYPNGADQSVPNGTQPACTSALEGTRWYTKGSGSINGTFQLCQNQSGTYTWVTYGSGGGGGFTASNDLAGSGTSQEVVGIHSVPLCTGFTPTAGQLLSYTTSSSPNPCWTAQNAPSGSFSAGTDLSGTSTSQHVVGINSVPICTGFSPTNSQVLTYTTGSSPNPCWTPSTPSGGGGGSFQYSALPVPSALSGFTWVNQSGSSDTATQGSLGGILISMPNHGSTQWAMLSQSVPATPWSAQVYISGGQSGVGGTTSATTSGLYLYDGTKLEGIENLVQTVSEGYLRIEHITNVTTDGSTAAGGTGNNFQLAAGGTYFRWCDDGTNLYAETSPDGQNWLQLYSEAVGTFITPTAVGFGGVNVAGSGVSSYTSARGWSITPSATCP